MNCFRSRGFVSLVNTNLSYNEKILKILGIALAGIILIVIVSAVYINASGIPSYDIEPISFNHTSSTEAIARGKALTTMLCAGCHMNSNTGKLTGKQMLDAPDEFGEIYAPNITQDEEFGIGTWTDAEIVYLLRTGIKRDGQYAPPYMAKLPLMADEDINAIIAFLRSDHPMIAPANIPDTPPKPSFLTKMLSRVAFKPFPMPDGPIPMPDTTNTLELGEYLAHNLDCYSCHSADFKSNDYLNPPASVGYFGGGSLMFDEEGEEVITANLTPHETGIRNMTKEQFIKAVRFGTKDGSTLSYPMLPYPQLTEKEVGAIYDYLQTVPPIDNEVERYKWLT